MKKIIALAAALAVSLLAFGLTACNGDGSTETAVKPIEFNYTFDSGNDSYVLKSVTISETAQSYVTDGDYNSLAELFSTANEDADYTPARAYTEEDVRTLTIPATYNGKAVKKIAEGAVANQNFVKKLVVEEGVEEIAGGAFTGLNELEEVVFPFAGGSVGALNEKKLFGYVFGTTSSTGTTSVTQQYNEGTSSTATFNVPSNLKKVTITGTNTEKKYTRWYDYDEDEGYTFKDEWSDEEGKYVLKDGATYQHTLVEDKSEYSVAPYAFYGCTMVEEVVLNEAITEIGAYTFYNTGFKTLAFTDNVKTIGSHAYASCASLRYVDFNRVETIGEGAFTGCAVLGKKYLNGNNVITVNADTVANDAFHGCSSLSEMSFTKAVTIGEYAFHECASLTKVNFVVPGVKVGEFAFAGCTSLEEIDLTKVAEKGEYSFKDVPAAENT